MNDELLDRAIGALREQYRGDAASPHGTEDALIEGLRRRERISVRLHWWLPLVAISIGSTAWATGHPTLQRWYASRWSREPAATNEPKRQVPSRVPLQTRGDSLAAPLSVVPNASTRTQDPPLPSEVPLSDPPPKSPHFRSNIPSPQPSSAERIAGAAAPASTRTEERTPQLPSSSLDHFREAQRLQSQNENWAGALVLWERYLKEDPHGPLVLEARYNRAVCLLRLGRIDAARSALLPFANGEYGNYRRDAARALLNQSEARAQ